MAWHTNTHHLAQSRLFNANTAKLSTQARARLSYERARAIGLSYALTATDVDNLTDKFWALHSDPILCLDGAAATLLTIQYNLVLGTLTQYARTRDDLDTLIDDLLQFRVVGQFCLTEIGHGLDAENLETTATLLPSGEFLLHTPSPRAAKFMPPTVPVGPPCVALIFARLLVHNEDRGIRPFIVNINDGKNMSAGVSARLLPPREGSNPVNHSITSFNHVRLRSTSLLGPLQSPRGSHEQFHRSIWRVNVGTLALSLIAQPTLDFYAAIGTLYSQRRLTGVAPTSKIKSPGNLPSPTPILAFRTQQIPLLTAISQASVLKSLHRWACAQFCDTTVDVRVRRGIAAATKAVSVQHSQASVIAISERCGAQGLFSHNMFSRCFNEMRGIAIAEGDILGLSIRLAMELILGRYELPESLDPDSLLARHEQALIHEARVLALSVKDHRDPALSRLLLPRCQPIVEAIGHRMAHDAAVADNVPKYLIDLYLVDIMKKDSAWYSEAGVSRQKQIEMEIKAYDDVTPHLEELVERTGIVRYINAPIITQEKWDHFVNGLELYETPSQQLSARL